MQSGEKELTQTEKTAALFQHMEDSTCTQVDCEGSSVFSKLQEVSYLKVELKLPSKKGVNIRLVQRIKAQSQ